MEVCGALVSSGCSVTVLEMMDRLVPALLDADMSLLLEKQLRKMGVRLGLGRRVSRIIGNESGRVSMVQTEDGTQYETDMVIVAIGVRPNVKLAKDAGLAIGVTGAIAVNEYMQTSDPDIYAGGDCVENTDLLTGRKVYVPLGSTANKHGRVIGDNVTGRSTRFKGVTGTVAFKLMNFNVGKTGLGEKEARELGFDSIIAITPRTDSSEYYPGNLPLTIKIIADRKGRLLGCQALGLGDVVKRIDVVAACLKFGANVEDLADLDLGYAPPYSTAIDAIAHSANVIRNKIEGVAHGISAAELKAKMGGEEDFLLLDVRSKQEIDEYPFIHRRIVNIPLGELRARLGELEENKEIITLCRTSVRAYEAERILRGAGFKDVKFLDGSIAAWPY
jgi:pyruvate/2-oxoglutarate dehydrogenase complex dihydrolipoamide dehydrogenase (E3) component/rhodanese-related sulfurtransferase